MPSPGRFTDLHYLTTNTAKKKKKENTTKSRRLSIKILSDSSFLLIILELRHTNEHKTRVQHTVSRLTTYRGLIYTYIYRIISSTFTASDCNIEIYLQFLCKREREKSKKAKGRRFSIVIIYIRKPTGHSLYISMAPVFVIKIGI